MTTRPLVLLPGMSGHGSFWEPVVEALRPRGPVRYVDWPGLGGNRPDPAVGSYDDLVARVLDPIGEPSVLVGQSMGGYVALRAALREPAKVSHLVLAVTSGGLDLATLGADDWRPGSRQAHPDAPDWAFAPTPDLTGLLPTVTVPVLLVWATADAISPLAVGRRLHELLACSRLVTLDSDDHWVAHAHAVEVAAAIDAFLS